MSTSKEDYFFLDVREEDEFNLDSVPKSFNMPVRKVLSVGYGFSSGFWEKMIPKTKFWSYIVLQGAEHAGPKMHWLKKITKPKMLTR